MISTDIVFICTATFGAFCQEVLHWYEIRNNLEDDKYKKLLRSSVYWVITILMIFVSGIGVWLMYNDQVKIKSAYFILGASFPLLFKKIVTTVGDRGEVKLGPNLMREYFSPRR